MYGQGKKEGLTLYEGPTLGSFIMGKRTLILYDVEVIAIYIGYF